MSTDGQTHTHAQTQNDFIICPTLCYSYRADNQKLHKCFNFPPHRTNASALSGETWKPEIAAFHLNAVFYAALPTNTEHIHIITQLHHLSRVKWSTECSKQQDIWTEHSMLRRSIITRFIKSVVMSVAVSTKNWAVAEGTHDALCQLKSC